MMSCLAEQVHPTGRVQINALVEISEPEPEPDYKRPLPENFTYSAMSSQLCSIFRFDSPSNR